MATGLRERQKLKRRQAILAAAQALFGEKGYDATSIEQIADRAEVAVGTVYNYFHSKEEILVAMLEHHFERVTGEMAKVIADLPPDPVEAISRVLDMSIAIDLQADRRFLRQLKMLMIEGGVVQREVGRLYLTWRDQLRGLAEALARQGLAVPDTEILGQSLFAIRRWAHEGFVRRDDFTLDQARERMRRLTALLVRGLAPRRAAA